MDDRPETRRAARTINAALGLTLAALVASSIGSIVTLHQHEVMRKDLAELQDVSHGMLDPDAWIEQVTAIIQKKIDEFQFTAERRREVKPSLERMLNSLLVKADQMMRKQRDAPAFKDRLKEDVREELMDTKTLTKGVPQYADAILDELAKPASRRQVKQLLGSVLDNLSQQTHSTADQQRLDSVLAKYGCTVRGECEPQLKQLLHHNHQVALAWTSSVFLCAVLLVAGVAWTARREVRMTPLALLVGGCAALMACGVLSPMLDVEARISKLSFVLMDEPMEFTNQVLYFQSKSVLDVVRVLVDTGKPDMILVGLLLVTFSIFFPLAKLTASFLYLYDVRGWRSARLVKFFALKSSKWSMADVFVVAMFMAYIGFNGVVNSELQAFANAGAPDVHTLTTNGSSLQLGYFLFLGFCIAGLVTSTIFNRAFGEGESHRAPPKDREAPHGAHPFPVGL